LNIKNILKIKDKKYEIKFKHQKYTERGFKSEIKIALIIYFYDKIILIVYVYLKRMLKKEKKTWNVQDLLTISSQM
jgi:hypothetical protein